MIALSSYAPLSRSSETARNQIAAKQTWEQAFSSIVYFNAPSPELLSAKTVFSGHRERPKILDMARYAAELNGFVAIVNSDIHMSNRLPAVESAMATQHVWCGTSRRMEFDPNTHPRSGRLVDLGLDFFFALPSVWALLAAEIPEQFVIGKQLWDTWTLSFFIIHGGRYCVDLTPSNLVWHPKHGHREDFHIEPPPGDTYLDRVRWPLRRLKL
jgi:hypothetical protein